MNSTARSKHEILVVDDDLDLNTTFALLLEFDGHEVRTAVNAEAALRMLEKHTFDLIIVEYGLPGMKGDELAALVKQKWPDQPIILTTANIQEFDKADQQLAGVDCLLSKPFSMLELREAMMWVFDRIAEDQSGHLISGVMQFGDSQKAGRVRKPQQNDRDF